MLPDVSSAIQDAQTVLRMADLAFAQFAPQLGVSENDTREFRRLMAAAYDALLVVGNTTTAVTQLDQGQQDEAFASFRQAWNNIQTFLSRIGYQEQNNRLRLVRSGVSVSPFDQAVPIPRVVTLYRLRHPS
jgi:hypothetical protein